jgi:hypothetical protein
VIAPDFRIEVLRDPTGCNLDPAWGMTSPRSQISVFRRPRSVANFKFIEAMGFAYDPRRACRCRSTRKAASRSAVI